MGMQQDLAQLYGEGASDNNEELQKQAAAQFFCKVAADRNINLRDLSDEQLDHLWSETMGKQASEGGPPMPPAASNDDDDEKKKEEEEKEAAAAVHAQKLAAAAEEARADELGRKMAHSFVDEVEKVSAARGQGGTPKEASAQPTQSQQPSDGLAPIDKLAAREAVKIASDGGFDADEAAQRVAAVLTLGLDESDKLASTVEEQVNIRALELLEAARYPVKWA